MHSVIEQNFMTALVRCHFGSSSVGSVTDTLVYQGFRTCVASAATIVVTMKSYNICHQENAFYCLVNKFLKIWQHIFYGFIAIYMISLRNLLVILRLHMKYNAKSLAEYGVLFIQNQ